MASSYSAADILKGALQKAGEKTDGTSVYQELALKFLNNAYIDILSGGSHFSGGDIGDPWAWARSRYPISVIMQPPFWSSVNTTQGSETITFVTPPASSIGSLKDWLFKSEGTYDYYKITAHNAGDATATIEAPFAVYSENGQSCACYHMIYSLPTNILRLCAPFRIYQSNSFDDDTDGKIYAIDIDTMDEKWPIIRLVSGTPDRYADVYRSETEYLIRFNKWTHIPIKIDMDYIPVPTDLIDSQNSIPIIPKQKRVVLEYATAYYLCQEKQLQDTDKFFELTRKMIVAMQNEGARQITQANRQRGTLVPREDKLGRNRYRGVY
jgi:hypothetical protein